MKKGKFVALLLSVAIMLSMAACSMGVASGADVASKQETSAPEQKTVHINLPESWGFEYFYPIITPENSSSGYGITYYLTSFYDTLVEYDASGQLTGLLAEDWSVSDDGMVYTFQLRKGVKFSSGNELTSADVATSLKAVPVNLGQYNGSYGKLSTIIEDVIAVDDYTVELKLSQPYYSTLRDLCLANPFGIVEKSQFNEDLSVKNGFETATYGTGPYMYTGNNNGQSYSFERNPHYWKDAPDVDSFTIIVIADNDAKLLALKNGEVDFISGVAKISSEGYEQMANSEGFGAQVDEKATQTYYLGYNLSNPVFEDIVVREAISSAIDKDMMVKTIFAGLYEKADTFFPKDLPYCEVEQTTYSFNLEKAIQMLDDAGYVDTDGDGVREINGVNIEAEFVYQNESVANDDMVVYICDQLKKIGISLTPKSAPMMEWYAMITGGQYGMTVFKTQGGYYDPANMLTNMDPAASMDPIIMQIGAFLPGGDKLINELNSSADEMRIQEIYEIVLQTIAEECLITPVYYTHQVIVHNDHVSGYVFPGDANYTSIQNIQLP